MTTPGVPLIYYGDEVARPGAGAPDNRRGMRFGAELGPEQEGTLAHVQTVATFRRAHPALRHGARQTLLMHDDGLAWAFGVETADDLVIVAFNRAESARTLELDVTSLGLSEGDVLRDALHTTTVTVTDGALLVELDGHDSAVFAIDAP